MLGSFKNWNILKLPNKAIFSEKINKINQVVLDHINENMDTFVKTGKYSDIDTTYKTAMGYYVIKLMSESYTLQEETLCDGQIGNSGKIVFKAQNMNIYAIKQKLVLVKSITEQSNYTHTHNYTSMLGCNRCQQSKNNTRKCLK